jgi:DNA mismatch endonuclease (patch repair protein)
MGRIASKDTQPEMRVRRVLHRLGLRYRLHGSGLPGKPDIVMRKWKTLIYVHGCFWHGHDCKRGSAHRRPKSNETYWNPKIEGNMKRDAGHLATARAQGWRVVVIWDCETANGEVLEARLRALFPPGDEPTPGKGDRTRAQAARSERG